MFVLNVPTISLEQTFRSGQYLRWHEVAKGAKYVVYSGDRVLKVEQHGKRLLFDCSQETFFSYWYDYFDIGFDYEHESAKVRAESSAVNYAAEINDKLHLIKQDPYDVLFTLALKGNARTSANKAWDLVCHACGERHRQGMKELGTLTWFEAPKPEEIIWNEEWLDPQELGEWGVYQIVAIANDLLEENYTVEKLQALVDAEDFNALEKIFATYESLMGIDWKEFALLCGCKRVWPKSHKVELTVKRHEGMSVQEFLEWNLGPVPELTGLAYAYLRASGSKALSALRRLKKDGKELPLWA